MNAVAQPLVVGADGSGFTGASRKREPKDADAERAMVVGAECGGHERVRHEPHVLGLEGKDEPVLAVLGRWETRESVDDQAQVRFPVRRPAERTRPGEQALANEVESGAVQRLGTAAVGVGPALALLERGEGRAAFLEKAPVAPDEVALGRKVVGQENVVAVEFDVPPGDRLDPFEQNGRAVDELECVDQRLTVDIDADRMGRGDDEVL